MPYTVTTMLLRRGSRRTTPPLGRLFSLIFILLPGALVLLVSWAGSVSAAGSLAVEISAAYNVVVDSNVESPSTYAPSVATVIGRFCNTGDAPLTGVQGYIGNAAANTPGVYPVRDSGLASFQTEHPHLANTGLYNFTHVGGAAGTADAVRYMDTLAPGACRTQYWHFTYPRRANPNNSGVAVWGQSSVPEDDLWLSFDIWGTSNEGSNSSTSWTMTMRNMISANANKILPNGGVWFNTNSDVIVPGTVITTNGVRYDIGNINKGFDNDGDFAYDYNAWLQPVGNPAYDPSCFRLIRTTGVLTVSRSAMSDLIIPFTDQLYFTNLPANNNGAVGNVHYTFLALNGPCNTTLSPYQEVASGADNEKFNGDFGYAPPAVGSSAPEVALDKIVDQAQAVPGSTLRYTMTVSNTGMTAAGRPDYGVPLVVNEAIPAGTSYIAGTVTAVFDYAGNAQTLFSVDGGITFVTTEPVPSSSVTDIQWWFNQAMPGSGGATFTFDVQVDNPFNEPSPFILNTAGLGFGSGAPFAKADALTMVQGSNSIGDTVWQDDNGDGLIGTGESGLDGVTVSLYWDRNGDGVLGPDDPVITTQQTSGGGLYNFAGLPNGDFIVQVDEADPNVPAGYFASTESTQAVTGLGTLLPGNVDTVDFGFAPSLGLAKQLVSPAPAMEGQAVVYTIDLTNLRASGIGTATSCILDYWATNLVSSSGWLNPSNALIIPDALYATSTFQGGNDRLRVNTVDVSSLSGNITAVEAIFSVYLVGALSNDTVVGHAYGVPGGDVLDQPLAVSLYTGAANQGIVSFDMTGTGWTPATFGLVDVEIDARKTGQADGATLYLDAIGYRVTVDEPCGGTSDVLSPVPLTDSFDADRLAFVSAAPAATGVTTGGGTPYANTGTISWNNVGPIYAGATRSITVTFKALEPPDGNGDGEADATTVTNTATVQNAFFLNGDPANDVTDDAIATLEPGGTIGDFVWNDIDGDGTYDPLGADGQSGTADDERGIPGVTLELRDGVCQPSIDCPQTTTDASGAYLFEGLADGTYTAVVIANTLPAGGAGSANSADRDGDQDGDSGPIIINSNDGNPANDDATDADFGYTLPAIIEGSIWQDWDQSGTELPDAGEEGLGSVVVYLDDGSCAYPPAGGGSDCLTTTTDAAGDYTFAGIPPGTYTVTVDVTTGALGSGSWAQTFDDPHGPDGVPGTADDVVALDHAVPVTVVPGGLGYADFSYAAGGSSSIGDTLYRDWNGDGTQDTGETGLANITVSLYEDSNGDGVIDPLTDALVMTTTTNISGTYSFDNLPAGNFIVVVDEGDPDLPGGLMATQDPDEDPGLCTVCDGQGRATTDGSTAVTNVDFGYQPAGGGSIGDRVWNDADGDGLQDTGETGLANIHVTLFADNDGNGLYDPLVDALVMTTTTGIDGRYSFDDLPPGDYLITVDAADADLPLDGNGDTVVPSTNVTTAVTLGANESYVDADFGFTAGATIGDYIWQDNDGDGTPDPSEPALAGITLSLWDDTDGNGTPDTLVMTTTTGADGYYQFTGLPAGDYVVIVDQVDSDLPASGSTLTGDPDESGTCVICDGQTAVSVSAGQAVVSADFGFQPGGVVGDTIWNDADGDGLQDPGEAGLAGVVVTLTLQAGGVLTTTTDGDGFYSFGDVPDGTHTVTVDPTTLPAGMLQTGDPDEPGSTCSTCDGHGTVTITGGNSHFDIDFGYQIGGPYSLGGMIYYDADQSGGDQGAPASEPGYEGVLVYLWRDTNGDGFGDLLIGTTTTGADGGYTFGNLPNGTYTVATEKKSTVLNGAFLTTNGNQNSGSAFEHATILDGPVVDVDFGFFRPGGPTAVELVGGGTLPSERLPAAWWLSLLLLATAHAWRRHRSMRSLICNRIVTYQLKGRQG